MPGVKNSKIIEPSNVSPLIALWRSDRFAIVLHSDAVRAV